MKFTNVKKWLSMLLVVCSMLSLVACGKSDKDSTGDDSEKATKVAVVFASSGLGDKSFNDALYDGMKKAESTMGIQWVYSEPKDDAEYEGLISGYADSGDCDLIICLGGSQSSSLENVAPNYPQQKFVILDAVVAGDNIRSYTWRDQELGFLAGFLGASLSDTNTLGFIGAHDIPLCNLAQLIQNLYTLHLFIILVYSILPETMQSVRMERFLYRELGIVIGVFLILYEQIRISMMQGSLRKEMWLPVLNDGGKVIGCIARSVSRSLPKKYYHPVVRVAVIYQGMLYLVNRGKKSFVSPDTIDYPFYSYVLFRHSIESTVRETMGGLGEKEDVMPRFLIRYTFENEKVKHLVNLYVMCVRSEKVMDQIKQPNGKLWTSKQIEENLGSGVFSEYFEQEFAYLQNTVLLAENFCCAGC